MEKFISTILITILTQGIMAYVFYKIGYSVRDDEIQEAERVQFSTNHKPVMIVEKEKDATYTATIYSKEKVKVVTPHD